MFDKWDQKLQKIINILESSDINEIEVSFFGKKFKVTKSSSVIQTSSNQPNNISLDNNTSPQTKKSDLSDSNITDSNLKEIVSPMVGTFYSSPSPDSSPFIDVNDNVRIGQTVCIIEAMKILNEIESDISGKIISILVKDGDPVEYGQKLFLTKSD